MQKIELSDMFFQQMYTKNSEKSASEINQGDHELRNLLNFMSW